MRLIAKPIDMISYFPLNGVPAPLKFKAKDKNEKDIVINIKKILEQKEERFAGNQMYFYKCQTEINGEKRMIELKYEVGECLWYLFRA